MTHSSNRQPNVKSGGSMEISILAGGLSTRMGRDKSRVVFCGRPLLSHVRATAKELGHPVRVIRRDLAERCGPLGGVFTGLTKSRADAVLFLACDMPFVSTELLKGLVNRMGPDCRAVFAAVDDLAGFPFIVQRNQLDMVSQLIARKQFSMQKLATALNARIWKVPKKLQVDLRNLNAPEDLLFVR